MSAFTFTSPDGKSYTVNGPDGATQDQAFQILQAQLTAPKPRTWGDVPLDALKNAPKSASNLIGGIFDAVIHPIRTANAALDIGAGALRNITPSALSNIIDKADNPEQHQAALAASDTADKVGQFYKQRYGSEQGFRDTLATDPVGALADATAVLQGGAGVARLAGKAPVIAGNATQLANALDRAASLTNPATPVVNAARYAAAKATPYVKTNPGNMLAQAIGESPDVLRNIAAAAEAAPDSILPGSKLTLAEAIALQGAQNPNVALLERTAAGGPGGNVLLNRYADKSAARMEALKAQGAEMYQGAPADLAESTGNKLGAILRTQALDDSNKARAAWKGQDGNGGVYGQALKDNIHLDLPLEDMQNAMSPLGRGSVIPGTDARKVLATADNIGHLELPPIEPLKQGPVNKSQSLEQAVRAAGGIKSKAGEVRDLGIRQSGTTGLMNNKSGQSVDLLAEEMHRRGFIPDSDPDTLVQALRNGGGRKVYATDQVGGEHEWQRMAESAMGDAPAAERVQVPVPFAEFQRLRRDSGSLAAKAGERAGGETEAGVLNHFQKLLTDTADNAAAGDGALGMSPEFLAQYNAARALSTQNADLYKSGNAISQILRKPSGQNYTLNGNEVTNKLWHGGQGLVGDVSDLKNVLSENNQEPALNALRKYVMTDAAGKVTASGNLGSAFPKYVENRLPGMQELMTADQLDALTKVAKDIRNSEFAGNTGVKGSDTQAKITRALDAGLLDSTIARSIAKYTSLKGIGGETLRNKLSEMMMEHKGKMVSELLADPKAAAAALKDADFVARLDAPTLKQLSITARLAPVALDRVSEYQK